MSQQFIRVILLLSMLSSSTVHADLQQEMDAMFGTMTNATEPTAHLGQRRGVITGGSVVSRNRIMSANLVSFVPPSFSAGCGGIDLYGGSFSFINLNQFVTLMRSVAANAAGYAFQLAINAMCPDCGNIMSDLQKKVQQLNQMFSNSCQLAQGMVNDVVGAFDTQNKSRMSSISFSKGISDVFGSWTTASSLGDPVQQVKTNAGAEMEKIIQGNLVWRALNKNNAGGWFRFGGNALLEAMMSVTGSVIVRPPQAAADGKGENNPVVTVPSVLNIKDLINGSGSSSYQKVEVYECDTHEVDGCLNPTLKAIALAGLKKQVRDLLIGTGAGDGLIYKFVTNTGTLTDAEKAFMELVPDAMGAMIRNLAREDYGMARLFVEEGAPVMALEMAQLLIQGMLDSVRYASALEDHAYGKKLMETLDRTRDDLRAEYAELAGRYGNPQTLMAFYENLVHSLKPRSYGSISLAPANQAVWPRP
jgi:conjugative transfer pilus assembly protein TraH